MEQEKKPSTKAVLKIVSRPIAVKVRRRIFELRWLSLGDLEFIEGLIRDQLPPREFTVQVLAHQLLKPELSTEDLREWPDDDLQEIARQWVKHPDALDASLWQDLPPFEAFQKQLGDYVDEQRRRFAEALRPLSESFTEWARIVEGVRVSLAPSLAAFEETQRIISRQLAGQLAPIVNALSEEISRSFARIALPEIQLPRLSAYFAQFEATLQRLEQSRRAQEALDETGFGFSTELFSDDFVRGLIKAKPIRLAATVTRRLVNVTSSESFVGSLLDLITGSKTLSRRRAVIRAALRAHVQRNYVLSIPPLLAQVEGVFGDLLVLMRVAKPRKGRLYLLNQRGRPTQELRGAGTLVNTYKRQAPEVPAFVEGILDVFLPTRNPILHGRNSSYGRARISVQVVLLLFMLAREVVEFESGT